MDSVQIKKTSQSEIEIETEIASDIFEKYWNEVVIYFGKSIKLPGFRDGKAPEKMIVERVGEIKILEEMASRAISDWYPKFLKEEKIDAIGRPEIAITKIARGNPLSFKVKQAVMPDITLPDYKKIASDALTSHKEDGILVTDEDVEKIITELRRQRKQNPDDDKEVAPALTDELAKSLGNFANVDELKTKVRENLKREKEMISESKRREVIVKAIVEKTDVEVPEPLIAHEQNSQIEQMKADVARMGAKFEDYLKHVKKTEADIKAEVKDQATRRAKTNLVIEAIAKQEAIEISEDEVHREVDKMMEIYKDADHMAVHHYVENVLRNERVFRLLEGRKTE